MNFLFGTMHVQDNRVFGQLPIVLSAIQQCPAFATEIKLEEVPPLYNLLPNGHSLSDLLPAQKVHKMRLILSRALGIDFDSLGHLPPVLLLQMFQQQLLVSDRFLNLDAYLYQHAKRQGKQTHGLEQLTDQLDILKRIPMEDQLRNLQHFCRNISAHRARLERSVQLYEHRDLKGLHRMVRRQLGNQRRPILLERNQRMCARFLEIAEHYPLFAAVGAGHLWGGHGLLRLLKQRGMTVSPVH